MKWLVMGGKEQEVRFRCLSDFLTRSGTPNEVTFLHPEITDFSSELEKAVKHFQQIRVQNPYGEKVQEFKNRTTELVNLVGCSDSLLQHSDGSWWPHNFMYEAFQLELIQHVDNLDLKSHALIVGTGTACKVVMGVLVKLGFSKFYLSDRSEEKAKKLIEKMQRKYFKVQFSFVPSTGLMLLPGSCSILINGTPFIPENTMLKDLYYFNFLRLPATIIDCNLIPPFSPLLEEGQKIGAYLLGGYEVAARSDVLWVQRVLGITLPLKEYKDALKTALSQVPFDPKPFQLA